MTTTYEIKEAFNRGVGPGHAAKYRLGDLLHSNLCCVKGTYSFARDGGATGDYNLKDLDGVTNIVIPSGSVVLAAFVVATAAGTSGGSATIDINIEAANDLLAAEAIASFSLAAKVQGIPDLGTLADSVLTTAARTLTMSVNTAALTAGIFTVYVIYA